MRDILEDAGKHLDDGYGRSQKQQARHLPKRFYKAASVAKADNGLFAVHLDGKPIRTPGRKLVAVPSEALAERLAGEWDAQGEKVVPDTMPLTRLVNTTIEGGRAVMTELRAEIVKYAGHDLLLYRAEAPRELVARETELWDAALALFSKRYDLRFVVARGVVHRDQPAELLERIETVAQHYGLFSLMALTSVTAITGSAVLALGLGDQLFEREFAWAAAHVEEDYNITQWGELAEIAERRAQRRTEFDAALDIVELVEAER
jgi:chaperone required for assembly of F1-ATPase